jgi:hypothetical protein
VPAWLRDVLLHALQKDRTLRWETTGAVGRALAEGAAAASGPPVALLELDEPTVDIPGPSPAERAAARPLVGREPELGALRGAMALSFEEPQATGVLVLGPPGVGKSRLCRELLLRSSRSRRGARPRSEGGASAHPARLGRHRLGAAPLGDADRRQAPLVRAEAWRTRGRSARRRHDQPAAQRRPERSVAPHAGSCWRSGPVRRLTRRSPVVLLVEDLQWADGATL